MDWRTTGMAASLGPEALDGVGHSGFDRLNADGQPGDEEGHGPCQDEDPPLYLDPVVKVF